MRIGVDARELGGRPTGAGRYLSGLLRAWAADEGTRRHEFILYAPDRLNVELDAHRFVTRLVAGRPDTWWEQVRLPSIVSGDRLDAFFAPAYTAPLRLQVHTIVTIHDVSFVAHPEWFRMREGIRRRFLTRQSAKRARAIVTVSECSRRALIDLLDVPNERIHVISHGVTALTAPVASMAPSGALAGYAREERVLFVGSIFNRRHVPDLIRSFAVVAARRPHASLDIVGDDRTYPREDLPHAIRAEALDGRIRWHRYVSEDQLRDFYARAAAFAFLSEYEGFGLTPLEALAAGVPPVLLDTPVAREGCGDAALYVPLGDLARTARALEEVLVDSSTRSRLLAAAPAVLARYSWPKAAAETLELIESCG